LSVAAPREARAQADAFGYIDANGLPAPGPGTPFFAVPSPTSAEPGRFAAALRSTVLIEPISGAQPSPDPEGTDTSVVSFLWLQEVLLSVGLGAGVDLTFGLPIHAPQAGQGLTGIGVGEALAPAALGDLRLGVGVEIPIGDFVLRPQGTAFLPTGQERDFAGERLPRGDLGVAAALTHRAFTFAGSLGVRLRETSTISNTRWSSQLLVAMGGLYAWSPKVDTTLELLVAPALGGQPQPESGSAGFLFPVETVLGAHYKSDPIVCGLFVGTGLPFSVAPGGGGATRAPTSPTLRIGVEIGASF